MFEFLKSQMDYLFFLRGLSFVLLSSICFVRARDRTQKFPWFWLALFSALYGLHEWTEMVAIALDRNIGWVVFEQVFFLGAIFASLECVRRSLLLYRRWSIPPWMHVPVFLLVVISSQWNLAIYETVAQIVAGWIGILGTAWALFQWRKRETSQSKLILMSSISLALYGVLLGTILDQSLDTWFQLFRQYLQTGINVLVAFGMWEYYLRDRTKKGLESGQGADSMNRWFAVILTSVTMIGWVGAGILQSAGDKTDLLHREMRSANTIELFGRLVHGASQIAENLSIDRDMIARLRSETVRAKTSVDERIDQYLGILPDSVIYLLNEKGIAIAASNRNKKETFVGSDYSSRPYFTQAIQGSKAQYLAMGWRTREPGVFLSSPVRQSSTGKIIGVVVVKVTLRAIDLFKLENEFGFLVDPHGVILLSSVPAYSLRSIWPISDETKRQLIASKQFPEVRGVPLVSHILTDVEKHRIDGKNYQIWRTPTSVTGWSFVFFAPNHSAVMYRLATIALTIVISFLVVGIFLGREKELEFQYEIGISEKRYRTMFEDNHAAMFLLNPETGTIDDANRAACEFYRLSSERLKGYPIFELELRAEAVVRSALAKTVQMGQSHFETQHKDSLGNIKDVEVFAVTLNLKNRQSIYCIIHDITAKKLVEKEKANIQAHLFHSEKLASVGILAAGVAHEVNNPLTIISGYIDLIKDALPPNAPAECLEALEKQRIAGQRIQTIVNSLRTYARADTDHVEKVDVHQCINDTLGLTEQIYKKRGILIERQFGSSYPYIQGNNGKLQQVIMNLVNNARDAMEDLHGDKVVRIQSESVDDFVVLKVSDRGTGIPADKLPNIFEPFYTTKPVGKGTGLGLPICRSIIESFGGKIEVESQVGQGTTFILRIPQVKAVPIAVAESSLQPRTTQFKGRVLVADDEEEIRKVLKAFLEGLGFEVILVQDGQEALETLQRERFDYVITDLSMPRLEGDVLLERAQTIPGCKDTQFIVTSGGIVTKFSSERRALIWKLASGYLRKPFDRNDLIEVFQLTQKKVDKKAA